MATTPRIAAARSRSKRSSRGRGIGGQTFSGGAELRRSVLVSQVEDDAILTSRGG